MRLRQRSHTLYDTACGPGIFQPRIDRPGCTSMATPKRFRIRPVLPELSALHRKAKEAGEPGVGVWKAILSHSRFAAAPSRFRVAVLRDAARSFFRTYQARQRLPDLDQALACWRQALALTPSDSSQCKDLFWNIGVGLGERYTRTHNPDELREAIRAYQLSRVASSNGLPCPCCASWKDTGPGRSRACASASRSGSVASCNVNTSGGKPCQRNTKRLSWVPAAWRNMPAWIRSWSQVIPRHRACCRPASATCCVRPKTIQVYATVWRSPWSGRACGWCSPTAPGTSSRRLASHSMNAH